MAEQQQTALNDHYSRRDPAPWLVRRADAVDCMDGAR